MTEDEVREPYGKFKYRLVTPVLARARVVSTECSRFMLAIYDVEVLRILEPQDPILGIRTLSMKHLSRDCMRDAG